MFKDLVRNPAVSEDEVKAILSGANGASEDLVTTEPIKKKKLRYTFNTKLRESRLQHQIEDETDEEDAGIDPENYVPTGAMTANTKPEVRELYNEDDDNINDDINKLISLTTSL